MKSETSFPGYRPVAARRINIWHAEVEWHCKTCSESVHAGLEAAWNAGRLLLVQKRKVTHGNWRLWLERHFDGTPRTAQRYMALAKAVPDVAELKGYSLRQAYLRLGIAVTESAGESPGRCAFLPMHAVLANRFQRWLRKKGDTAALRLRHSSRHGAFARSRGALSTHCERSLRGMQFLPVKHVRK